MDGNRYILQSVGCGKVERKCWRKAGTDKLVICYATSASTFSTPGIWYMDACSCA